MGARTEGSQGIKWRTVLLRDRNVHASLRCAKFHHRYQSPGEVKNSQLLCTLTMATWGSSALLSLGEKARLLWMDCSSRETVQNFL